LKFEGAELAFSSFAVSVTQSASVASPAASFGQLKLASVNKTDARKDSAIRSRDRALQQQAKRADREAVPLAHTLEAPRICPSERLSPDESRELQVARRLSPNPDQGLQPSRGTRKKARSFATRT
jgi:hypothetical protein